MKRFVDWIMKNARLIWQAGGVIVLIGEILSAVNKRKDTADADKDGDTEEEVEIVGDTISETYKALPEWLKILIGGAIGFVFCHLAEWRIRDPIVQIEQAENVNVESDLS